MLVGFNRGDKAYEWRIPTPQGATVSQLFVASGEVDKVLTRVDGATTVVTLPALEAAAFRLHRAE